MRLAIAESMQRELGDAFKPPRLLRRLVTMGHVGKKAGKGFYLYDGNGDITGENPAARPPR